MKRSDYYIFGLAAVNIYFFTKFAGMVVSSTIASVIERGDFFGYAVLSSFLIGIIIVFNNMSQLVTLITEQKDEHQYVALARTGVHTITLLAVYAVLVFFDAYLVYNLYGGY